MTFRERLHEAARRKDSWVCVGLDPDPTKLPRAGDVADEMLHFAKWGWVQGVGSLVFGVADRLFVGSFLGATSLAFYSVASQLALFAIGGCSVLALTASALWRWRDADSLLLAAWVLGTLIFAGRINWSVNARSRR